MADDRLRSTKTDKGRGQNGLYQKLLRCIAEVESPADSPSERRALMGKIHDRLKKQFNGGKTTTKMSTKEFDDYYLQCQASAIEAFGVSGLTRREDNEFDHGGKT